MSSQAKVPWQQIEKLRQQSVVVRVVLDSPQSELAQKCPVEDVIGLGTQLSNALETAKTQWARLRLTEDEAQMMRKKANGCDARGSCHVYLSFLDSVQAEAGAAVLVKDLNKLLQVKIDKMRADAFEKAWSTVSEPCQVIGSLKTK